LTLELPGLTSMNYHTLPYVRSFLLTKKREEILMVFEDFPPCLTDPGQISAFLSGRESNLSGIFNYISDSGLGFRVDCTSELNIVARYWLLPFIYVAVRSSTGITFENLACSSLGLDRFSSDISRARFFLDNFVHSNLSNFQIPLEPQVEVSMPSGKTVISTVPKGCVLDSDNCTPALQSSDLPAQALQLSWVSADPTDLRTYERDYEFIQRQHERDAEVIVDMFRDRFFIVPGDGSGLFASVCDKKQVPGVFGDIVFRPNSHPQVHLEDIEETIDRGLASNFKSRKPLIVFSYVSLWVKRVPDIEAIWIDTPSIRERFNLNQVSEFVYTSPIAFKIVPARRDTFRANNPYRRIPYLKNLLRLSKVFIHGLSNAVVTLIRDSSVQVAATDPTVVSVLKSYGRAVPAKIEGMIEVCDTLSQSENDKFYFVPLGRMIDLDSVEDWDGVSPVYVRTIYRVDPMVVLPRGMSYEDVDDCRYCFVGDDKAQILRRCSEEIEKWGDVKCYADGNIIKITKYFQNHLGYDGDSEMAWRFGRRESDNGEELRIDLTGPFCFLHPDYVQEFEVDGQEYRSIREAFIHLSLKSTEPKLAKSFLQTGRASLRGFNPEILGSIFMVVIPDSSVTYGRKFVIDVPGDPLFTEDRLRRYCKVASRSTAVSDW